MEMIKIAIIGQQCSGKTSACKFITERLMSMGEVRWVVVEKFARGIYKTLDALGQEKHRAFMQEFGDLAKRHFGELVFVDAWKKAVQQHEDARYPGNVPGAILCDDIRRGYELAAAKELGFFVIYIDAPAWLRCNRAQRQGLAFIENHNSETEVPSLKAWADLVIQDTGLTMDELRDICFANTDQIVREWREKNVR